MEGKRILLVEDQDDIASVLELHLSDLGAKVKLTADGYEGMQLATTDQWDMVILDIQLPGPSGLDICRTLRKREAYVPVLFLTSRSTEFDRVLGLDIGADDYLTKPFSIMELMARIKAIFRRETALTSRFNKSKAFLQIGQLSIDQDKHKVTLNGQSIELTAREFELLSYFARHPGRVFNRSELLDNVWGYGHQGYEHTVNSHINRLRSKIESDPNNPEIITTVWGVGYKLEQQNLLS